MMLEIKESSEMINILHGRLLKQEFLKAQSLVLFFLLIFIIGKWEFQWKIGFNPYPNKQAQEVIFSWKFNKANHLSLNLKLKLVTQPTPPRWNSPWGDLPTKKFQPKWVDKESSSERRYLVRQGLIDLLYANAKDLI